MSLSKEKSIEVNYRRDSFSDRVCDDLCEVILKYLSLEDRLRLECVSKQFQRTALNSKNSEYLEIAKRNVTNTEPYLQLLKKYPKLNRISFVSYYNQILSDDFFEVIIENINNLTHIQFRYGVVIDKQKFFDKFGHKLISFQNSCDNFRFTSIEMPNIEELTVTSFDTQLSQMTFNRLKSLKVFRLSAEDLNSFEIFIENNTKTLKHLEINRFRGNSKEDIEMLLKIITKSINLVHLSLDFGFLINQKFANYWKEIAINCKQIKSLKIKPKIKENLRLREEVEENRQLNDEIVSVLKQFNGLKRLDLEIMDTDYPDDQLDQFITDLKHLNGLTHLRLNFRFYCYHIFNEKILTDIDINFPKLKYFVFNRPFIASEWTAQVFSRLSCLESIYLPISNKEMRPEIERQLIKNCKHLKRFY